MRRPLLVLSALAMVATLSGLASAAGHRTSIPPSTTPSTPQPHGGVPCDTELRYDDGSDDTPGSGPTLGWFSATQYQFLSVRFTPPLGQDHKVQSASWFSDFWVLPGLVDVTAQQADDPGNTKTVTLEVTDGGTWEVEFPEPICLPAGTEYFITICPRPGVFGVVGEDNSAPDTRSYFSFLTGCGPVNPVTGADYMIWSCVTPCGATPVRPASWGSIKGIYR